MTIIYLESSHLASPFFCNKQSFFEKLQYVLCIVCYYAYHFAPNIQLRQLICVIHLLFMSYCTFFSNKTTLHVKNCTFARSLVGNSVMSCSMIFIPKTEMVVNSVLTCKSEKRSIFSTIQACCRHQFQLRKCLNTAVLTSDLNSNCFCHKIV